MTLNKFIEIGRDYYTKSNGMGVVNYDFTVKDKPVHFICHNTDVRVMALVVYPNILHNKIGLKLILTNGNDIDIEEDDLDFLFVKGKRLWDMGLPDNNITKIRQRINK